MVRDYELMYIVRPDLDEEAVKGAMDSVQNLVEGQSGEVVKTTSWGKRRLAYEIQRLRDGYYVLLHIRLDGARIKELERVLRIHDNVFRHMLTIFVEGVEAEDGRRNGRADGANGAVESGAVVPAESAASIHADDIEIDDDLGVDAEVEEEV
jgi:small subunit ribosomal protein S6